MQLSREGPPQEAFPIRLRRRRVGRRKPGLRDEFRHRRQPIDREGLVRQPLPQHKTVEDLRRKFFARQDLLGDFEHRAPDKTLARAIAFLLSEWSVGITGEIVHVDGGYHAMGAAIRSADA